MTTKGGRTSAVGGQGGGGGTRSNFAKGADQRMGIGSGASRLKGVGKEAMGGPSTVKTPTYPK